MPTGRTGLRADACSELNSVSRSPGVITPAYLAGDATKMTKSHRRNLLLLASSSLPPEHVNKVFSAVIEGLGGADAAVSVMQVLEDCQLLTDQAADLVAES